MAGAMRTCVTAAAAATPLSPSRIASAANRRAVPSISLRPANGRAPRRGVSSSSSSSAAAAASISDNRTAVVASPPEVEQDSAAEVVRRFYGGINNQDLSAVEGLVADKCVYEDLIFPRPFVGREAILDFFKKFNDIIGSDLRFVIDDISEEDSSGVGVTWHLDFLIRVERKAFSIQQRMQFLSARSHQWKETDYLWKRQCRTCIKTWGDCLGCN
ncbi:hypothetical protein BT93_F2347 [Corymbia citriodora subsp. variegata]|nr:hypothetical protein BT93_F2347 [Corymbia citriodora subsp. variegata]